jgi:predicted transcriptional regulator
MIHRDKTDIIAQILRAANGGSTKTKMMYNTFLSYDRLKNYVSILIMNDLLRLDYEQFEYRTTEKGIKFLNVYEQIEKEYPDLMAIFLEDKSDGKKQSRRRPRFSGLFSSISFYATTAMATILLALLYLQDGFDVVLWPLAS